jgi:hypothetical protein
VALAKYLHDDPKNEGRTLKDLAIPALPSRGAGGAHLRQPDLGTATIHVARVPHDRARHEASAGRASLACWATASRSAIVCGLRAARLPADRVEVFLNPEADLLTAAGTRTTRGSRSATAGCSARGYMKGTQNQFHFMPDQRPTSPSRCSPRSGASSGRWCCSGSTRSSACGAMRVASQARDRFGAILCVGASGDHLLARRHQHRHGERRAARGRRDAPALFLRRLQRDHRRPLRLDRRPGEASARALCLLGLAKPATTSNTGAKAYVIDGTTTAADLTGAHGRLSYQGHGPRPPRFTAPRFCRQRQAGDHPVR